MYLELMGKIFLIIGTLGISVSAILFFRFDIIKAGYETGYIKFKGKKIKDKKLKNTDFNNSKFDNRSVKNKNPDISKSSRKFLSEENGGIKRNKENIENKENYENNENIKIIADKRRKQFDITYSVKVCNSDVSVWNI